MAATRSSDPLAEIKICFVCLCCASTSVQGFLSHTSACRGRPPRAGLCSQTTWERALPECPGWGASCSISRLRPGRKKSTGSCQPALPAERPAAAAWSPGHGCPTGRLSTGGMENAVFRHTGAVGGGSQLKSVPLRQKEEGFSMTTGNLDRDVCPKRIST